MQLVHFDQKWTLAVQVSCHSADRQQRWSQPSVQAAAPETPGPRPVGAGFHRCCVSRDQDNGPMDQWTNVIEHPVFNNIQHLTESNIVIHKDKKFSGQKHSPTPRAMGFPSPIPGSVLHLTQTKLISTCAERSTSGLLDVALCGTLWHFMAL